MVGIEETVKYVKAKADRHIDDFLIRNVAHWFWAILANRKNKYILYGIEKKIPNYFGIALASSNVGKSWILKQFIELLDTKHYEEVIRGQWKNKARGDDVVSRKRDIKCLVPFDNSSTKQGIQKVGEAFSFALCGSVNFVNEEMFATANDAILDKLYTAYDGIYQAPQILGDEEKIAYEDAFDVSTNLLGMTALSVVLDDKIKMKNFITKLKQGLFRRSFVTMTLKQGDDKIPEYYEINNYVKSIINGETIKNEENEILLEDDASDLFLDIRRNIKKQEDDQYSELQDPYKTLKLAGIRAYSRGSSRITVEDINYAEDFRKTTHRMAVDFTDMKNTFANAYRIMVKQEVNLMVLKKLGIVEDNFSRKKFDDLLIDIEEYCITHNAMLLKKTNQIGGTVYKVEPIQESNKIRCSFYKLPNENVKNLGNVTNTDFGEFNENFAKWMSGKGVCLWTFNKEKTHGVTNRTKDNAIDSYMICFDFEQQINKETGEVFYMNIIEVKQLFMDFEYILRTSKSHGKEIKDRFHIYIPYTHKMELDMDTYTKTYKNIAKRFGIYNYIDISTSHRASWFRETFNPKICEYHKGKQLDYRCCVPDTKNGEKIERGYEDVQNVEFRNFRLKRYLEKILGDLVGGKRDNSINAFVYTAMNDIKAEPIEIKKALDIIKGTIDFNDSFRERDMNKFYKRIDK